MPLEYDSPYQKLWDADIIDADLVSVVVEVGINDGRGIRRLRERFPQARIFAIDEHIRDASYKTTFDQLAFELADMATLIIEKSPLPFDWPFPYDFCSIDIGADPDTNFRNIVYWLRYKSERGVLAIVVPKGSPEKLEKRDVLIGKLLKAQISFNEIANWFVFK